MAGINFDPDKKLRKLERRLNRFSEKQVDRANIRALKRSQATFRQAAVDEIQTKFKLSRPVIKDRVLKDFLNKSRGELLLEVSGEPLSLIRFVKGSKKPRKQKGVRVSKRRRFKYEVEPNKVQTSGKNLFIVRLPNGRTAVAYRTGEKKAGKSRIGVRKVVGISNMFLNERSAFNRVLDKTERRYFQVFNDELTKRLNNRLAKAL